MKLKIKSVVLYTTRPNDKWGDPYVHVPYRYIMIQGIKQDYLRYLLKYKILERKRERFIFPDEYKLAYDNYREDLMKKVIKERNRWWRRKSKKTMDFIIGIDSRYHYSFKRLPMNKVIRKNLVYFCWPGNHMINENGEFDNVINIVDELEIDTENYDKEDFSTLFNIIIKLKEAD